MVDVEPLHQLTGELRERAWAMYVNAFEDLKTRAAQRHMLHREEFNEICADKRLTKYVATVDGFLRGMAILTDDLDAWPLIQPEFFEHRWPDEYASKRLWYLGFVCATKTAKRQHVFAKLLEVVGEPARELRGVVIADFCDANRHLPRASHGINLSFDDKAWFEQVDSQGFYAFGFSA